MGPREPASHPQLSPSGLSAVTVMPTGTMVCTFSRVHFHRTQILIDLITVSLVDGFNIPMSLKPSADCTEASCPKDLDPDCPKELVGTNGSGCLSACADNIDGNAQDSTNYYSGSHDTTREHRQVSRKTSKNMYPSLTIHLVVHGPLPACVSC
jgi:hypothetical protein